MLLGAFARTESRRRMEALAFPNAEFIENSEAIAMNWIVS